METILSALDDIRRSRLDAGAQRDSFASPLSQRITLKVHGVGIPELNSVALPLIDAVRCILNPACYTQFSQILIELTSTKHVEFSPRHPTYRGLLALLGLPEAILSIDAAPPDLLSMITSNEGRRKYEVCLLSGAVRFVIERSLLSSSLWNCLVELISRRRMFSELIEATTNVSYVLGEVLHSLTSALNSQSRALDALFTAGLRSSKFVEKFVEGVVDIMVGHNECETPAEMTTRIQSSFCGRTLASLSVMSFVDRATIRQILRIIMTTASRKVMCHGCLVSAQKTTFAAVMSLWSKFDEQTTLDGEPLSNRVGDCVSYCLLHARDNDTLLSFVSGETLADLLNGISKRFDQVRYLSLRRDAVRVAMQFSELLSNTEITQSFDEFPHALEEWMRFEAQSIEQCTLERPALCSPSPSITTTTNLLSYPIDPDLVVSLLLIRDHSPAENAPRIERHEHDETNCTSVAEIFEALTSTAQDRHHRCQKALAALPNVLMSICTSRSDTVDSSLVPQLIELVANIEGEDQAVVECLSCCLTTSITLSFAAASKMFASGLLSVNCSMRLWQAIAIAISRLSRLSHQPQTEITPSTKLLYPPMHSSRRYAEGLGRRKWKSKSLGKNVNEYENAAAANAAIIGSLFDVPTNGVSEFVVIEIVRALHVFIAALSPARLVMNEFGFVAAKFLLGHVVHSNREVRLLCWIVAAEFLLCFSHSDYNLLHAFFRLPPDNDEVVRTAQSAAIMKVSSMLDEIP